MKNVEGRHIVLARVYEVKGADITVSCRHADIEIARMFSAFSVPDVD